MQAPITMVCDFDQNIINDIFNFSQSYQTKEIHVAVFPLETKSVILLFIKEGERKYRKFYKQLNALTKEDQLSAINFMIFAYTENVFINPTVKKIVEKDSAFMSVCRKSTNIVSLFPFVSEAPIEVIKREFDLSQHSLIPNLLSEEFSLRRLADRS